MEYITISQRCSRVTPSRSDSRLQRRSRLSDSKKSIRCLGSFFSVMVPLGFQSCVLAIPSGIPHSPQVVLVFMPQPPISISVPRFTNPVTHRERLGAAPAALRSLRRTEYVSVARLAGADASGLECHRICEARYLSPDIGLPDLFVARQLSGRPLHYDASVFEHIASR